MQKLTLYVVTHKSVDFVPDGRTLIGVGDNKNIEGTSIFDNTGDNISDKNKNYCELTALYWIWKNDKSEYVGLEHYRRFFCSNKSVLRPRILSKEKIEKLLEKYDCIIRKRDYFSKNLYNYYAEKHYASDLDECKKIISENFPDYMKDYNSVMYGKYCSMSNMFVAKKEIVNDYCEWLFAILFELEKRIDITERDSYQKRVYGFLSERLFNVWLHHNNIDKKYYKVCYPNEIPIVTTFKSIAKFILRK